MTAEKSKNPEHGGLFVVEQKLNQVIKEVVEVKADVRSVQTSLNKLISIEAHQQDFERRLEAKERQIDELWKAINQQRDKYESLLSSVSGNKLIGNLMSAILTSLFVGLILFVLNLAPV